MPQTSTGCYTCRKRKIRCDERRPGCERCAIHGVPCGGYRFPPKQTQHQHRRHQDRPSLQQSQKGEKSDSTDGGLTFEFADMTTETARRAQAAYAQKNRLNLVASAAGGDSVSDSDYSPASELQQLFYEAPFQNMNINYDLHSASLHRTRLYNNFIDIYLPVGQVDPHFAFIKELVTTPNPPPLLSHALDALSLVQVGAISNNKSLLTYSSHAYSRALRVFMHSLQRSTANPATITTKQTTNSTHSTTTLHRPNLAAHDQLLAANAVLAICECYEHIALSGDSGWMKHMRGSVQLLASRGPASVAASPYALEIYAHFRHSVLSHAMIARRACFMGSEEWRRVGFKLKGLDGTALFYDVTMRIPGALERVDWVLGKGVGGGGEKGVGGGGEKGVVKREEVGGMVVETEKLIAELEAWLVGFTVRVQVMGQQELYRLAPIEEFVAFDTLVQDRLIDEAFVFTSFLHGYIMSLYWCCMMELKLGLQEMQAAQIELGLPGAPNAEDCVSEEDLLDLAIKQCQCMPYFVEPSSSSLGAIGIFLPLRAVVLFFLGRGYWQLAVWGGRVRIKAFVKGMAPPDVEESADSLLNHPFVKGVLDEIAAGG